MELIGSSTKQIKPVSATTQRLVDRCLMAEYLDSVASPHNFGNGISRIPTPNALATGMDIAVNTNSSNGNGLTVN